MKRNNRIKGVSLLLAAVLAAGGCGSAGGAAETEASVSAVAVETVNPELGTLTVSNEFIGTVTPQQQVNIIPLVSGEVDQVYFEVGDEVKAGDVLFHIDDEAASLQLESAQLTKQSAEVSARSTLGTGQVLSNISMESNIKSIQYQIDMAKDQYNSAVDGVADSEEAKADLNDAIDQIDDSVDELKDSYNEMKKAVSGAKQVVEQDKTNGVWQYRKVYWWDKDPSHYTWTTTEEPALPEDKDLPKDPTGDGVTNSIPDPVIPPAAGTEQDPAGTGSENTTTPSTEPETGTGTEPSQTPESTTEPSEPESEPAGNTTAADPDDTGTTVSGTDTSDPNGTVNDDGGQNGGDTGNGDGTVQKEEEQPDVEPANAPAESTDASASSVETISYGKTDEVSLERIAPAGRSERSKGKLLNTTAAGAYAQRMVYEDTDVSVVKVTETSTGMPDSPVAVFPSKELAWEAYNAQQQINQIKKAMTAMGYNAADIGEGRADSALQKFSEQIASMQSQAATLKSQKSSLESGIETAESGKKTAAKTVDFYEENLTDAQKTYGIQNGQAYQDTTDALQTQIQSANVGVKSAQMQLEYYTITTPISGKIISMNVEEYGMTQAGYAACVISNQDAMNVTFYVSEAVRNTLQPGMQITLERNDTVYEAAVTEIGEAVDPQTGLFLVEAVTEANGDALTSGVTVKVKADTYRSENAVLIPYDAVYYESEQAYVYVVEDGIAVRTVVETGLYNEDQIEITAGLDVDAQVVKTWSSQLEDGAAVRVIGSSAAEEAAPAAEQTESDKNSEAAAETAAGEAEAQTEGTGQEVEE